MTKFQLFAARDGDTVSELIDVEPSGTPAIDAEIARGKAFASICKAFQLDADAYESFDDLRGDLDGCELTNLAEQLAAAQRISASSPHRRALELVEQIARFTLTTEIECGQCEGTGTTDAMGHDEECPVCNGTGEIAGEEHGASEALDALVIRAREIATGVPCNTPPTRVLVALEGGCVQGAVADRADVRVIVLDYDVDNADPDNVFAIPQSDGDTADAFVCGHSAIHDPAFIDGAEAANVADPEGAIAFLRERAEFWDERPGADAATVAAQQRARAGEIAAKLASEEATA